MGNSEAHSRLRVFRGDVASSNLGLADADLATLRDKCGVVVHCAALVNHMAGWRNLERDNVGGVRELLSFCAHGATSGQKRFVFVSTADVLAWDGGRSEDA